MKRIIFGLITIIGVGAIVVGATGAFFSDTETSTGNKFVVGKLNLKVDSACHYNGMKCDGGVWTEESQGSSEYPELIGQGCECTWLAKDLDNELFFNFLDIKPGDFGENTVSLHVENNDAWVCAELANLESDDNGCDSPENKIDQTCEAGQGELQDNLFFTIWKDTDCDNVLDAEIPEGPGTCAGVEPFCNDFSYSQLDCETFSPPEWECVWTPGVPSVPAEQVLVDSQPATSNFWPIADSTTGNGPIESGSDYCLGIAWNVPIRTSNIIQTDSLTGDVVFSAVQARHMNDFQCSILYPNAGLIAYWPFDEESGSSFADESGNGNDGTLTGAEFLSGKVGNALYFDGVNDFAIVPYSPAFNLTNYVTDGFSIEEWVNVDDTGSHWIFSQFTDTFTNNLNYLGRLSHTLSTGSGIIATSYASTNGTTYPDWPIQSLSVGAWHHVVSTYKANIFKLYIDGVLKTTSSLPGTLSGTLSETPFVIGAKWQGGSNYDLKFKGYIDEMKIYSRALTAAEVEAHYQIGL